MKNRLFLCLLFLAIAKPAVAELSSYEELILDVAESANISKALAESIIDQTFKEITVRLKDNKGTSIPEFGRFYVQEKYDKKASANSISKKSTLNPRFSMSPELKKRVQGLQ